MTRLVAWAALATVAAVVVGCGPAKELPDEVIKPTDPGEKPIVVPAASDPKAKEYVDKAVKAYTAGKPELVTKGKSSRVVLKGRVNRQDVGPVETTRAMTAVWPDRFAGVDDSLVQGRRAVVSVFVIRPQFIVLQDGQVREDLPARAEMERNLMADETAQYWMSLLLPLLEPKAVVFDLQSTTMNSQSGQSQPVQELRLSLPDFPLFQLSFDAKTSLLIRVGYATTEQGVRRRKQWLALEHKPDPDGRMLPSKIECRHEGQVVEQWEIEKWEFPATISDVEFNPPKK